MASEFLPFDRLCDAVADTSYDRRPAIVCNAHITGLAVARSLDAAGVPVIAIDRDPDGVAPYSNAVDHAGRVTYPLDDEAGFRDDVEHLADRLDHEPIVFPCMDEWVLSLARTDPDGVELPFASFETIDGVLDKSNLYERARDLGVPIPETHWLDRTDPADAADALGFPLVLKPALKRRFEEAFGTNLVVVESREEYRSIIEKAAGADVRLLAQEFVPKSSGDLYTLGSYVPESGVDDAVTLVGNRTAVYPPEFGTTCLVETATAPAVEAHALDVLDASGYQGISEAEFLYDERRDEYVLLDVNTRPWKWIGMLIQAGADLPVAAYRDATDEAYDMPPTTDSRWVYLRDYLALASNHRVPRGLGTDEWTAIVSGEFETQPDLTTAVYAPSDPGPTAQLLATECSDREYYCAC
jgi:D-aspartate ligase